MLKIDWQRYFLCILHTWHLSINPFQWNNAKTFLDTHAYISETNQHILTKICMLIPSSFFIVVAEVHTYIWRSSIAHFMKPSQCAPTGSSQQYSLVNRNVLSRRQKVSNVGASLMSDGRLFQILGDAYVNILFPVLTVSCLITVRSPRPVERSSMPQAAEVEHVAINSPR